MLRPAQSSRIRQRKLDHWAAEYRRRGPAGSLAVADGLREHVKMVQPGWPARADRERDLEQHARMRALYDRAAHALIHVARSKAAR